MFPIYALGCFTIGRTDLFCRPVTLQEFKSNTLEASDFKLQGTDDGDFLDTVSLFSLIISGFEYWAQWCPAGSHLIMRCCNIVPTGEGCGIAKVQTERGLGFFFIAARTKHRFYQRNLQAWNISLLHFLGMEFPTVFDSFENPRINKSLILEQDLLQTTFSPMWFLHPCTHSCKLWSHVIRIKPIAPVCHSDTAGKAGRYFCLS